MNLPECKRLILHYKLAVWSKRQDRVEMMNRKNHLKQEVKSGLFRDCDSFRGSMGTGGFPNRRQRRHVANGGSLYRDGFHWICY